MMRKVLVLLYFMIASVCSADPLFGFKSVFGNLSLDWPMKNPTITSQFGFRDDLKKGPQGGGDSIHFGIDLIPADKSWKRVPILAAEDGVVVVVYPAPNGYFKGHAVFGGCVQIQHDTGAVTASGKKVYVYTFYAHLKSVWVKEGQRVKKGEFLGLMGDTGKAQGNHLHYEISFDPMDFMPELAQLSLK
jgi:murein DD-endopeptidase MepM/ murein hydrolase activator NlpD